MANNMQAFEAEFLAFLTNTVNIDSATKTKLRNRRVARNSREFQEFLTANGLTDTPTNRGRFLIKKTVDEWRELYHTENRRELEAALQPEVLE